MIRPCSRLVCALPLVIAVLAPAVQTWPTQAQTTCRLLPQTSIPIAARPDTLLPSTGGGPAIVLAGRQHSLVRFLPHDDVMLLPASGPIRTVRLPAYTTPPGIARAGNAIYLALDDRILLLDPVTGKITARWTMDMTAVGWPAAVTALSSTQIVVAGQPKDIQSPSAVLERLSLQPGAAPRILWRHPLGLTHAGIWVGQAGNGHLAAYVPNASDVGGTVAVLDTATGRMHANYPALAPPAGIDAVNNRLYLNDGGTIRALWLNGGTPAGTDPGSGPLAVIPGKGDVAFVQNNHLALTSSSSLHPLATLPLPRLTALAAAGSSYLLAGRPGSLTRIALSGCSTR